MGCFHKWQTEIGQYSQFPKGDLNVAVFYLVNSIR